MGLRVFEYVAQPFFAFTVELADDLRARNVGEINVRLRGYSPRNNGLSGTRRAVEQYALRWLNAKAVEDLREAQRQFDHLADSLDLRSKPPDVLVGYLCLLLALRLFFHVHVGGLADDHCSGRRRVDDAEVTDTRAEEIGTHPVVGKNGKAFKKGTDIRGVALFLQQRRRGKRTERNASCEVVRRRMDGHLVVDTRLRVVPCDTVNLDHAFRAPGGDKVGIA